MKTCVVAALITLTLSASVSAAGLFITVGQHEVTGSLTDPVDSFVDVFFQIEPPVTLPDLAGYQVALDLAPASSGVAFGAPTNTEPPHDPIFAAAPTDLGSTADRIQATQFLNVRGGADHRWRWNHPSALPARGGRDLGHVRSDA